MINYDAPFDEMLIRNGEQIVHVQNLQKLMAEVHKSLNNETHLLCESYSQGIKINDNLRVEDIIALPKTSTASQILIMQTLVLQINKGIVGFRAAHQIFRWRCVGPIFITSFLLEPT